MTKSFLFGIEKHYEAVADRINFFKRLKIKKYIDRKDFENYKYVQFWNTAQAKDVSEYSST